VPSLRFTHLRREVIGSALHLTIYQQNFSRSSVKLKQSLLHLTFFDLLPNGMTGKAAIAFVDERTGITLFLLCRRKSLHPGPGISSKGRHR